MTESDEGGDVRAVTAGDDATLIVKARCMSRRRALRRYGAEIVASSSSRKSSFLPAPWKPTTMSTCSVAARRAASAGDLVLVAVDGPGQRQVQVEIALGEEQTLRRFDPRDVAVGYLFL